MRVCSSSEEPELCVDAVARHIEGLMDLIDEELQLADFQRLEHFQDVHVLAQLDRDWLWLPDYDVRNHTRDDADTPPAP